jgi:hypothetical protein
MVFSYFWFFVGLPMGFLSAISRIVKSMVVGALMLPRVDQSVMPDGFQQIDQGDVLYIVVTQYTTLGNLHAYYSYYCSGLQKHNIGQR